MRRLVISMVLAAAAGFTFLALPAAAENMTFKAALSGKEEVPPNTTKGHRQYRCDI